MFRQNNFGRPLQGKSSMSIEKSIEPERTESGLKLHNYNSHALTTTENLKTPFNGSAALVEQKFAMILKEQDPDTTEVGVILKFVIPAYTGERKRYLKLRKAQINFVNYFDDTYPCFFSICTGEIDGLLDKTGVPSKILATLPLQQLTTNISNDFMTLNLLYQTEDKDEYMVDVTNIPSLTFYINEEMSTTREILPLASHLLLEFSIFRSLVGLIPPTNLPGTPIPIFVPISTKK